MKDERFVLGIPQSLGCFDFLVGGLQREGRFVACHSALLNFAMGMVGSMRML